MKLTRESVIYQIYPRSFQDSNGDGIGDLDGITSRLEHIAELGADGIWLSPIFSSPQADMGYDVSNFCDIAPEYGDIAAAERLITRAHNVGLAVLFDIVPCHTSIEHPWFREHPDFYIIRDTPERPNNWASIFGGRGWDRDPYGRGWYYHTYYREQPNLNWRNPELVAAMYAAMRFWIDKGLDGYRVDAIPGLFVDEQLRDNPPSEKALATKVDPEWDDLVPLYNTRRPDIYGALAGIRQEFPDTYFVAEAVVPTPELRLYTEHFDAAFCFTLLKADPNAKELVEIVKEAVTVPGIAWAMSNHDQSRIASRWGQKRAGIAALLQLTLPGSAYIYQGDELGMVDGESHDPPYDRVGRDPYRNPMQWTSDGGFTEGEPWLQTTDSAVRNVADQRADSTSMLHLYQKLIALHHELSGPLEDLRADGDLLQFRRDDHHVAINFGDAPASISMPGKIVTATREIEAANVLPPFAGVVSRS